MSHSKASFSSAPSSSISGSLQNSCVSSVFNISSRINVQVLDARGPNAFTSHMSFKIEPKDGVEVYLSEKGYLCIKQLGPFVEDDDVVMVHPDDIEQFVQNIQGVYQQSLDYIPPADEE